MIKQLYKTSPSRCRWQNENEISKQSFESCGDSTMFHQIDSKIITSYATHHKMMAWELW